MAAVQRGGSVFLHLLHTHCAASDLGPISVNWFEELTAEAVQRQSRLFVGEEKRVEVLDDSLFKTPKHKRPTYSQLDSTPIIFKEQSLCSPLFLSPPRDPPRNQHVAENVRGVSKPERSPGDATQILRDEVFGVFKQSDNTSPSIMRDTFKTPIWDKKYLHRTPQRDGKSDVLDSLCCTPKLMGNVNSRCISESLGAEADPEMSWSSSLATPPSPTVIIAQPNAETSETRPFDNKDAVIVQSLFSSKFCNNAGTSSSMASPTNPKTDKDMHTKANSYMADSAYAVPNEAAGGTFESSKDVEVQKNILKNEDACQMEDGMEDILSIFFNSGKPPGLRKVKIDSRAKRRKKHDSNVIQESAGDQRSIFPFLDVESQNKCNHSDLGNKHFLNDPSFMPSSYDWSPLALPDSNLTQGDMHLPTQTNLVMDEEGKELRLPMNDCSPNRDNEKSSLCHKPAEPCKVTNILETSIPNAALSKMPDRNPDMDITDRAQTNTRDTEGNTSADRGLPIQQVLFEKNERRPQTRSMNIKATLSVLKRQSKFLYHLNDVKNGQDGRTKDISKVSHSEHFAIPEKDDKFGENQKTLDSVKAACTHSQQDAKQEAKEESFCLKELDGKVIDEDLSNLKHADRAICEQTRCLGTISDISITINIDEGVKKTVNGQDATRKMSFLESITASKKNTFDDNAVGHIGVTKNQVQETNLSSDVTSDKKEQLESHKGTASSSTDRDTYIDSPPPDVSHCMVKRENFGGFKTASNKNIHISEETLRKGELLFKDDDLLHHSNPPLPPAAEISKTLDVADSTSQFIGFKTASCKAIKVSESKIAKAMLLFKDIEDGICENIAKEDLLIRPAANLVSENAKTKELDSIFEPLSNLSSEKTKHKNPTSNLLILDTQSTIEVRPKGMGDQNIVLPQHGKNRIYDEKPQIKKTSLSSEMQILTESQKAEVCELSSILENADSQFDFTQFRKTGIVTISNNQDLQSTNNGINESETFNNSDVWKDVDFNDSFSAGTEHVEINVSGVRLSLKKESNTVEATAFDSGVASISEQSVSKEENRKFGGFSLASGKCINITDEDMVKAFELFSDLDDTTLLAKHPSTDVNKITVLTNSFVPSTTNVKYVPKDCITVPGNVQESSILCSKEESSPIKGRSSTSNGCRFKAEDQNLRTKLMRDFVSGGSDVSGSEEALCVQNINNVSRRGLASASGLSAMPLGFSTAKGEVISVDKAALAKAKVIFNDILHPEGIHKNQGGTSSVVVKENESTFNQGEECKGTHQTTVERSAVGLIVCEKGVVVPYDMVQLEGQMFRNDPGTEPARCTSLSKEDTFLTKKVHFSNAHGKPVHLSKESLKKAQEMFADIDTEAIEENSKVSLCEVENISDRSPSTSNFDVLIKTRQEKEPVLPLGFSTASGKSVVVSCDSLQKARALFAETDIAMHNGDQSNAAETKLSKKKIKRDCAVTMKTNTTSELPPLGFSTASGKKVAVSNEALHKARLMLADTDSSNIVPEFQSSQTTFGVSNQEICRDRDSGSSENAKPGTVHLAEVNAMKPCLEESAASSSMENPDLQPIVKIIRFPDPRAVHLPQGNASNVMKPFFSTAGGKPVQMSDEALKKAREMFAEIDDGQLKDLCSFEQSVERNTLQNNPKNSHLQDLPSPTVPPKKTTLAPPSSGFSTASGKTVAVSADALHKARILLADCGDGNTDESIGQSKLKAIGNKNCEDNQMVSKLSPFHSDTKEIKSGTSPFSEGKTPQKVSSISAGNNFVPGMSCFSTASGKTVSLSEEALKKAQKIFAEIENCPLQQDKSGDVFSNHPISKNLTSLQKKPKETTLEIPETNILPNATTNTLGFSTASGKHVSVSETAIQKVKNLFEELQEHFVYNDKSDGNISKKVNMISPLVNKPEHITHSHNKLGDLQSYRARTIDNNTVGKLPIASSSDIQGPMPRHSTPFHNARVPGKMNFVSSVTSHTPENYLEIEAAESTKAFMDDEDLTDGIRAAEATNKPLSFKNGKRLRSDDRIPHGEPPIKRQLLPEFDRSFVQESKLTLKPLTSSPHSDFKDRRTFLYNVSLKASFSDPTSFSAGKKEEKVSRSHFNSKTAAFQHSSSDNSANASHDGRQSSKTHSYRPATGTLVSPFMMAGHVSSEEQTSNQAVLEPHNSVIKLEEVGLDVSQLVANVHCARDMQEMRIRKKQRQKIKPQPGSLYQLKASSADRIPLVSAVQGTPPTVYTKTQLYRFGVLKNHIGINSETAKMFDFNLLDYFTKNSLLSDGGVQIADGGWLVPSDKLTAGREEFYRALCDTPGVDPKLISPEWVYNHYRWIVWKLASMEVMFPEQFGSRCLTPERVLLQLKYRYEVEIDKSQRSALRRIMERDDTAAKTLVLCVSKVLSSGCNDKSDLNDQKQSFAVIEVTDGWYGMKTLLDASLTMLLHRRRLFIGQKIIVHGSELVGSEEACTPLEAPDSLMLKLAANSTRPARWYTRLGYFSDPRPLRLPLSSLFAQGGIVGCIDIIIQRVYPMQWMEKMANGTYIFRNDRAEEREAERHSSKQQKNLEALFLKIQEEFEKQEACERKVKGTKRSSLSAAQIAALQDGAEIFEALQNEPDPGYLESCMSSEQLRVLNHHRQLINDRKQALIQSEFRKAIESAEQGSGGCARREVTPVWKMRIVDYKEQDPTSAYILNIWRPLPDVVSLLKEGCRFKIYQLAASQSKGKADMAAVQLTATKKTQFQQLQPSPDLLDEIYTERRVTSFSQLLESNFTAEFGEVDIVGLVISTHQKIGAAPLVYLSDEASDFVAVKFWADLAQLSLEELAKPGTFIAASNLHWRSEYTAGIPIVFAGDLSYIVANPKEPHLQKAVHKLRQSVQAIQKFRHEAELKLLNALRVPHSEERRSLVLHSLDASTHKFSTPVAKLGRAQMNPVSTPDRNVMISSSNDMDPKTCKKMKGLDFLSRIPSPPSLTPVRPMVSPSLQRGFRPPRSMQKDVKTREQPIRMSKGEFVADEELAMINTQALVSGLEEGKVQPKPDMSADLQREKISSPNQSEVEHDPSGISSSHTTTKKEDPGFADTGRLRKRRRHRL